MRITNQKKAKNAGIKVSWIKTSLKKRSLNPTAYLNMKFNKFSAIIIEEVIMIFL
jgi:hypothetical protein